jgi:hypothetical protein
MALVANTFPSLPTQMTTKLATTTQRSKQKGDLIMDKIAREFG